MEKCNCSSCDRSEEKNYVSDALTLILTFLVGVLTGLLIYMGLRKEDELPDGPDDEEVYDDLWDLQEADEGLTQTNMEDVENETNSYSF